jgi:predicted NUDIX family NTP pyrophosphohydrolase
MLSIVDLSKSLLAAGIDLEKWSPSLGTKSIDDLQAEIDVGETQLQSIEGILTRVVKVVNVTVRVEIGDRSFLLVEDKQIFFTGAIRERGLKCLAEKIINDEQPEVAARRALQEEIGLNFEGELVSIGDEIQQQSSPSYPGLSTQYQFYNYQIELSIGDLQQIRFIEIQEGKMSLFTLEPL